MCAKPVPSEGMGLFLATAAAAIMLLACAPLADADVRADFNGDGLSDLAIGAPRESLGTDPSLSGAVHILYGTRHRLDVAVGGYLTEDTPGIKGGGASGAYFGQAVAAGDFDGDGYADLAIGAPSKSLGYAWGAGSVHILYGGQSGLTPSGNQYLTENSPGIKGGPASEDANFGEALASGDFDRDGRDDLAIGAPGGLCCDGGAVHILYGARRHLTVSRDQYLTAENLGAGTEHGAVFGWSLAAGDLNGDRRADLAVGSQREQVGASERAGAVRVLLGGAEHLRRQGVRLLTAKTDSMAGPGARIDARFGRSLAIGRFNRGWRGDLAIGVPRGGWGPYRKRLGAVHVLYGGRRGPSLHGDQFVSTTTPGIKGQLWGFGDALASGDLNGDGRQELAIGSIDEAAFENPGHGAVHILYGARRHLKLRNAQFLTQDTAGMAGDGLHRDDLFGYAFGAGDFDGDGRADLAIGEPQIGAYDSSGCHSAGGGGVHILYGARNRLSLNGDQFLTQDTPGIAGDGSEQCDLFGGALSGAAR